MRGRFAHFSQPQRRKVYPIPATPHLRTLKPSKALQAQGLVFAERI
jgi:hypothetical protein